MFNIAIISVVFFFAISMNSNTKNNSLYSNFEKELNKDSFYALQDTIINNEFFIVYPRVNNSTFKSLINQYLKKDLKVNWGCNPDEIVYITYEAEYLTDNILSIYRITQVPSCGPYAPSMLYSEEGFNFFIYDDTLYKVEISKKLNNKIISTLKNFDNCIFNDDVQLKLYFRQNQLYVKIWKDVICNYLFKKETESEDLIFIPFLE